MGCSKADYSSLLIKKITGELLPVERQSLESHLDQCASCSAGEQELTRVWQRLGAVDVLDIPLELYEKTQQTILARLKRETSPLPWLETITRTGSWSFFLSVFAGLAMTGLSYLLIHNLGNLRIYHHYVLIALFSLWWLLFAGGFWFLLKGDGRRLFRLDWISAWSISITLLTLVLSFSAYEVDSIRWLAMSAAHEVALLSDSIFGMGNTFITSWWIYGCLASFIGAFIFRLRKGSAFSYNVTVAAGVVSILLLPAIYLQGSSHNHGYGIIAFAALGTFVGSLLGISLGFLLRRQVFYQPA